MCNKQWSKKAIARARTLYIEGQSARQTAMILCAEGLVPPKTSRNAVIGLWHRQGISERKAPPAAKRDIAIGLPQDDGCQWPHGDPDDDDFHFCGAEKHEGYSYCTTHCHQAYNNFDETTGVKNDE